MQAKHFRYLGQHASGMLMLFKGALSAIPLCAWANEPREPEELPRDWAPDEPVAAPLPDQPAFQGPLNQRLRSQSWRDRWKACKVIELGVWVAGPAAAGILADWGADVIKIEPPAGDPGRMFGRMLGLDLGVNPPFELDNRSKRSIVLDLTTDAGRATAFELLSEADVFVTNLRPGALQRLGLDYESVSTHHPRLVYGLITGYGETGPDADRAAYDVAAFWSRAGVANLLTRPGDTPPFQRGGMGDHSAGMTLAAAMCAALLARERDRHRPTGEHLAVPPGRLHRELRHQHLPADRPAHRDRAARIDGQPVHEQLRRRRRATILDRRARGQPPLAPAVSRRGSSRVADRSPVRRRPRAAPPTPGR